MARDPMYSDVAAFQTEGDCPGPWLRTWIEFHVDARVNHALREIVEGELLKGTSKAYEGPSFANIESHESLLESSNARMRIESERDVVNVTEDIRVVAQNQEKLLGVLEGIQNEVAELKTKTAGADLQTFDTRTVQQLETKFSVWREEVASEVRAIAMREKGESESLRLEALAAAASRTDFEERFEALRLDFASATRTGTETERRLEYDRREFERRIDRSQRQLLEHVDTWTADLNASLEKELKAHEQRLYKEIRSELSVELQRLKDAMENLDEQLWLTDKRLGAKVEDLAQTLTEVDRISLQDRKFGKARKESLAHPVAAPDHSISQDASFLPKSSTSPRDVSAAVARTLAETVGDGRGGSSFDGDAPAPSQLVAENIGNWYTDSCPRKREKAWQDDGEASIQVQMRHSRHEEDRHHLERERQWFALFERIGMHRPEDFHRKCVDALSEQGIRTPGDFGHVNFEVLKEALESNVTPRHRDFLLQVCELVREDRRGSVSGTEANRRLVGSWRGKLAISPGSKAGNQDVSAESGRRGRLLVPPLRGLMTKTSMLAVEGFAE
mmetsp:Transcript_14144/g.23227  ORF Transcript_14144/g.23227 Transcript_14144/m.23227 type:complete len:560 (+) Transcript_14144:32-1711(+)